MINQVIEARDYLGGKNISIQNVYRMCYLIAKLLLDEGCEPFDVRQKIFDWANKHHIHIDYSVNSIIEKAKNDKTPLRAETNVWVGEFDAHEIVSRFDRRLVRCDALAMLCYSKAYSNKRGDFSLPYRSLAAWVGNGSLTSHWKVLRELVTFGYLDLSDSSGSVHRWSKKELSDGSVYRIKAPVSTAMDYALEGNDIWKLYNTIFDK